MTWSKNTITKKLLSSGLIALDYFQKTKISIKPDRTIVTEADQAIEDYLTEELDRPDQGIYLLGEETQATKSTAYFDSAMKSKMYIVDPIDGTAPYSAGLPTWGISIGYAENGILTQGAIYLPVFNEIYISEGDKVYLLKIKDGEVISDQELYAKHGDYDANRLISVTQTVTKKGTVNLPNTIHSLCCAVMPLAYIIHGRYMAYLGTLKVWDLAGGLPLIHKLGFECHLMSGKKFGPEITKEIYHLEGDHCWRLRDTSIFASPGIAQKIIPHISGY